MVNVLLQIDNSKDKNEGKEDQTSGLSSNPTHVLQENAESKTSKNWVAVTSKWLTGKDSDCHW